MPFNARHLSGADFTNVAAESVILAHANAQSARFTAAKLSNACMIGADLTGGRSGSPDDPSDWSLGD
ncbi:pentapeptide repeat-containing protein [Phytohabitans houttuyneae]|uniref:pentapeptide repeat-containing protein n=1 Tax=Phytohabitans houttuyneae TaxID=1076126 RepID=UPI0035307D01